MSKPFYPAAATALLHAALLVGYVAGFGGDVSALVCADRETIGRPPLEAVTVGFDTCGYDGQFYYAIARAPWRPHDLYNDNGAIRQARVLYPAICWLFSGGGNPQALLWVMPLVNLFAIVGLAWIGAAWAMRQGWNAWWGCLLPLAVNAGLPALRDLTDPVATFAVCGLLYAWLTDKRWWVLTLWSVAALFAREQSVVIVLIVWSAAVWRVRMRTALGLTGALLLWSAWILTLRQMYGEWPFLPSEGNTGIPFAGMLYRWTHLGFEKSTQAGVLHVLRMLHLTAQLGLVVLLLRQCSDRAIMMTALAGAALAVIGGISLYIDGWSYTRVFAWMPLAIWFGYLQVRRRWPVVFLSLAALWPLAVVVRVWLPGPKAF
jgi:hypothetical protein